MCRETNDMFLNRTYIVVLVFLTADISSKRSIFVYIYCSHSGAISMPLVYSPESLRALRTERTVQSVITCGKHCARQEWVATCQPDVAPKLVSTNTGGKARKQLLPNYAMHFLILSHREIKSPQYQII